MAREYHWALWPTLACKTPSVLHNQKMFWTHCLSGGVPLLGQGWHGQGGGALEEWAGLWVSLGPQPPLGALLEERGWHMVEAERDLLGLVQSRSQQVFHSHLQQEKSVGLKHVTQNTWQWLNQLFLQNIGSQLGRGVWVSYPSPALLTVQSTSSQNHS